MAIGFGFPEEVTRIVAKVHDFCEQIVAPGEKEIETNEGNCEVLVLEVIKMPKRIGNFRCLLHATAKFSSDKQASDEADLGNRSDSAFRQRRKVAVMSIGPKLQDLSQSGQSPASPPTNGVRSRSRPPDGSAKHRGTG